MVLNVTCVNIGDKVLFEAILNLIYLKCHCYILPVRTDVLSLASDSLLFE